MRARRDWKNSFRVLGFSSKEKWMTRPASCETSEVEHLLAVRKRFLTQLPAEAAGGKKWGTERFSGSPRPRAPSGPPPRLLPRDGSPPEGEPLGVGRVRHGVSCAPEIPALARRPTLDEPMSSL